MVGLVHNITVNTEEDVVNIFFPHNLNYKVFEIKIIEIKIIGS